MRLIFTALALVHGVAPAAAQKFDLTCSTEVRYAPDAQWRQSDAINYRIDLTSRRWCKGDCSQVWPVAGATGRVIFLRSKLRSSALDGFDRERISRDTGELSIVHVGAGPIGTFQEIRGKCEPAEFSGFQNLSDEMVKITVPARKQ